MKNNSILVNSFPRDILGAKLNTQSATKESCYRPEYAEESCWLTGLRVRPSSFKSDLSQQTIFITSLGWERRTGLIVYNHTFDGKCP